MILAHGFSAGHAIPLLIGVLAVGAMFVLERSRRHVRSSALSLLWIGGVVAGVVATLPVVESAATGSFTAHMLQHLLLWIVAPALLVAAHPMREVARAGWFRPVARLAARLERHPGRLAVAAGLAVVLTMYGTHLTSVYDLALTRRWLHEAEHGAYFASSLAFWSVVLGRRRSGAGLRIALAAAVTAPIVLLGMILTTTDSVLYPTYLNELGAEAALHDQQTGGAIMWLGSLAALFPLLLWLPWQWATNEQRRQETRENATRLAPEM